MDQVFTTVYLQPTKVLYERAESSTTYATDSNGCVVCPSSTPQGPTCGKGQERLLRTQTCEQCPEYYCEKTSGGGSTTNIGAIVGGVVGGVVAILLAGLLYYFLVWRKNHPSLDEDENDIIMSDLEMEGEDKGSFSNDSGQYKDADVSYENNSSNDNVGVAKEGQPQLRPPNRRANSNPSSRRLSSYESFTRPQRSGNRRGRARKTGQRQTRSRNGANQNTNDQYSPYLDPNSSNRNSIATTISTTNASNILPIAYIPGVTVRPTKNNTKSIYSYETDSIFSDLNTIENASIIGDIMRANQTDNANGSAQDDNGDGGNTMTAIKAQPRLVNVDRIDEEDEDYELSDQESNAYNISHDSSDIKSSNANTTTRHLNNSTLSNVVQSFEDEDSDSDVDSDIGEIQRAASITRNKAQVKEIGSASSDVPVEIPIGLIDLGKPRRDLESALGSNNGSFVLDVEIDNNQRDSQNSGDKSPFEDP